MKPQIFQKAKEKKMPVWLMRQAGRYMKEYLEIRKNVSSFLDMCYSPNIASRVTLQPINAFDLDAAIIFSDILVIPDALNREVEFVKNQGPKMKAISNSDEIAQLVFKQEKLEPVYQAISKTREMLDSSKDLIGFAGSPWTIAAYMLEGQGSRDFLQAKKFAFNHEKQFAILIELLIECVSEHLCRQIEAGANIVKLFDSWCSVLPEEYFKKYVVNANLKIAKNVKEKHPNAGIIIFPKSCGVFYREFVDSEFFDVLAIDQNIPISWVKENLCGKKIIQGNLDPGFLLADEKTLDKEIERIITGFQENDLIFNLSHGVNKETNVENVEFLVKKIRSFS